MDDRDPGRVLNRIMQRIRELLRGDGLARPLGSSNGGAWRVRAAVVSMERKREFGHRGTEKK